MSAKVANLIAIETGILIGIISWLVYSHLPSRSETTALPREGSSDLVMAGSPISQNASESTEGSQRFSTAAYNPDREQARLMAEREASLQAYYRTLAPESRPIARSENEVFPVDTSSYAVPEQNEVVSSEYYPIPPPTVLYYAPALQNVVVADTGHLRNRGRSPHRRDGTRMNPRTCPPPTNIRPNVRKVIPSPKGGTPPSPALDESKPRQTIAQPAFNGRSQKRATSPASTGSTRRFVSAP